MYPVWMGRTSDQEGINDILIVSVKSNIARDRSLTCDQSCLPQQPETFDHSRGPSMRLQDYGKAILQ
jgi:hypothetical protein